jgi:polyisoprenoid-binding protein YceI
MRKIFFLASIVAISLASCGGETTSASTTPATATPSSLLKGDAALTIDVAASKLSWKGEMLGLYSHNGSIDMTAGKVNLKDGKITSGDVTINMASIKPLDDAYEPTGKNTKENLIGHLSTPDFFDIANNPTSTFTITSVNGSTGKGNLTLRGVTQEETIEDLTVTEVGKEVKITGTVKFDRTKYGAKFAMPIKEKVLSNDIQMTFELIANK